MLTAVVDVWCVQLIDQAEEFQDYLEASSLLLGNVAPLGVVVEELDDGANEEEEEEDEGEEGGDENHVGGTGGQVVMTWQQLFDAAQHADEEEDGVMPADEDDLVEVVAAEVEGEVQVEVL